MKPNRSLVALLAVPALVAGCAVMASPDNRESVAEGTAYQSAYRAEDDLRIMAMNTKSIANSAPACAGRAHNDPSPTNASDVELLSRGDLVEVSIGADKTFSGRYEVSRDGALKLPHLHAIPAQGRSVEALELDLSKELAIEGYYKVAPDVSIRVADFAPARVNVAGAVFQPGGYTVGGDGKQEQDTERAAALGANGEGRSLSTALRAAGGVRPDADLSRVVIRREGQRIVVDVRPAIEGRSFPDVMLISGDEIEVPSLACFLEALVAPTAITTPGVLVFMSNLTQPAASTVISRETRELPYGTRFVQAVFGMGCVGGTQVTNADRSAVLFSRNPITGESIVIERRLEELLRRADRDEFDPFIMPGDAIACYDSTIVNITEVARVVVGVVGAPLALLAL